jgi:trehalose 6-phosphate phosphatase
MGLPGPLVPLARDPEHGAVIVDFDGSLSTIVDDPADATVLPEARDALAALVGHVALVAVVSGRPVAVLDRVLAIDGLSLVGQYGLERREDGGIVVDPRIVPYRDAIAAAADEAERTLAGLLVERKEGVAVTVHWRATPARSDEATRRVDEIAARHGLTVYATRQARELRPPVPVDKGTAVEALLGPRWLAAACFAGDDRGDVPAFDALDRLVNDGRLGTAVRIAVRSGEAPPELLARADVVVEGPPGLAHLLADLARD